MAKKKPFKDGMAVATNGGYAKIVGNAAPVPGTLVKRVGYAAEVWVVRLQGYAKPQYIHERYLEVGK